MYTSLSRHLARTTYVLPIRRSIHASCANRDAKDTTSPEQKSAGEKDVGKDKTDMPAMTGKGDSNRKVGGQVHEEGRCCTYYSQFIV